VTDAHHLAIILAGAMAGDTINRPRRRLDRPVQGGGMAWGGYGLEAFAMYGGSPVGPPV